jgi:hypothetical protein
METLTPDEFNLSALYVLRTAQNCNDASLQLLEFR